MSVARRILSPRRRANTIDRSQSESASQYSYLRIAMMDRFASAKLTARSWP